MTKKILNFIFSTYLLIFVLSFFTSAAYAATASGKCGVGLKWSLESNGTLTISGSGAMYSYAEDKNAPWYSNRSLITQVEFGNEVTSVGSYAFNSCKNLKNVVISESVTLIEPFAFYACSAMTDIDVSSNNAHYSSINGNLYNKDKTVLLQYAIGKSDTSFTIPNSVKTIGAGAFAWSTLTDIAIYNNVTSIKERAFYFSRALTNVTIPGSVISIEKKAFSGCWNISKAIISDGVVTIEDEVFYNCSGLTDIKIPKSLTTLGKDVFVGCVYISNIDVESDNKYFSSIDGVLYSKDKTQIIMYPPAKAENSYSVLTGVKTIGTRAFANCENLSEIILPDSVEAISDYAFYSCTGLTKIIIPENVSYIGICTFFSCKKITDIKIPEGIDVIKEQAFYNCISLNDVYIPDSVTIIEDKAFQYCEKLESIVIPSNITSIGQYSFSHCYKLTDIAMSKSVNSIWLNAFSNCNELTNVYYTGSESDWNKIAISTNPSLAKADKYYNCNPVKIKSAVSSFVNKKLTVNVEIKYSLKNGILILAVYDDANKLIALEKREQKRSLNTYQFEKNINNNTQSFSAVVFMWDNMNSMSPLCDKVIR